MKVYPVKLEVQYYQHKPSLSKKIFTHKPILVAASPRPKEGFPPSTYGALDNYISQFGQTHFATKQIHFKIHSMVRKGHPPKACLQHLE